MNSDNPINNLKPRQLYLEKFCSMNLYFLVKNLPKVTVFTVITHTLIYIMTLCKKQLTFYQLEGLEMWVHHDTLQEATHLLSA